MLLRAVLASSAACGSTAPNLNPSHTRVAHLPRSCALTTLHTVTLAVVFKFLLLGNGQDEYRPVPTRAPAAFCLLTPLGPRK